MKQKLNKKHPGRVAAGKRLAEWNRKNMKKIGEVTLKSLLNDIRKYLGDPALILVALDETIRIMKHDYNSELCITTKSFNLVQFL